MKVLSISLYILHLICGTNSVISKLIHKAASVANTVYKHQSLTAVVWWQDNADNVNDFLNRFHGSVMTLAVTNIETYKIRPIVKMNGYNQTIIFASSVGEFENYIDYVNRYSRTSIYLILVMTTVVKEYELFNISKIAWKNNLTDIVIITDNGNEDIRLTTYFPFSEGNCENYSPVTIKNNDLFPKKFRNFYRCPIKASVLHFLPYVNLEIVNGTVSSIGGIDGDFFMFIVRALNSTVHLVSWTDHGGFGTYGNGQGTGSFGDLLHKGADIVIPAGMITHSRYLVSQITHAYHIFDVYWCGPKRRKIYPWANVLLPLFTNITPFLFLSFAVFVLTTILAKRCKLPKCESRDGVFFQSFVIFLGQGVKFMTTSSIVNSLYILWIWFCFIVRIVYQGDLIDGLEKDILEPRFGTIEETVDKVDGLGGAEVLLEYYRGTSLEKKYEVLSLAEIKSHLKDITEGRRYLLATDMIIISPHRRVLQVLDAPIGRATTCFYMRLGWPAAKQVDRVMLRLIETGILENIIDVHNRQLKPSDDKGKEANPLNMSTLSACFYGLMFMWLICGTVLVVEIIYYNYKQKKNVLV